MRLGWWFPILLLPYCFATIVITDPYADLDYQVINVYSYTEEVSNDSSDTSYDDDYVDDDNSEPSTNYVPFIFYPRY